MNRILTLNQPMALAALAQKLAGPQAAPERLAATEAALKRLNPALAAGPAASGATLFLPPELDADSADLGESDRPFEAALQAQRGQWAEAVKVGLEAAHTQLKRQAQADRELQAFATQAAVRRQLEASPELKARAEGLEALLKKREARLKQRGEQLKMLGELVEMGLGRP